MKTVILTLFLGYFLAFFAVCQCKAAETPLKNQKYFTKVPSDGKQKAISGKCHNFCAVYRQLNVRKIASKVKVLYVPQTLLERKFANNCIQGYDISYRFEELTKFSKTDISAVQAGYTPRLHVKCNSVYYLMTKRGNHYRKLHSNAFIAIAGRSFVN